MAGGLEAGQVDRVEVGVGPTLDGLEVVMAAADLVSGDPEVEVVGVDRDSVDPEVADGVAQDPTHLAALEDGILDLEVTVANLQMAGIARALEAVQMAVGSLVGDLVFNETFNLRFYKFIHFLTFMLGYTLYN